MAVAYHIDVLQPVLISSFGLELIERLLWSVICVGITVIVLLCAALLFGWIE